MKPSRHEDSQAAFLFPVSQNSWGEASLTAYNRSVRVTLFFLFLSTLRKSDQMFIDQACFVHATFMGAENTPARLHMDNWISAEQSVGAGSSFHIFLWRRRMQTLNWGPGTPVNTTGAWWSSKLFYLWAAPGGRASSPNLFQKDSTTNCRNNSLRVTEYMCTTTIKQNS